MTDALATKLQLELLQSVADRRVNGICWRYVWTFIRDNADKVTGAVNALEKKGLVSIAYYSGGEALVNITDAGRAALASAERDR